MRDINEEYVIRIENLTKSYNDGEKQNIILQNVNYNFIKGNYYSLMGKSGIGKSTK